MKKLIFLSTLIFLTMLTDNEAQAGCEVGDCQNGFGIYTWSGRSTYKGYWKDGRKHGQGKETWNDGARYVGGYKNGKWHGQGTFTGKDGRRYEGNLKNGKRHGQGTFVWKDGRRYEGNWENGKRHGQGTLYFPDGKIQAGLWEKNSYMGTGLASETLPETTQPSGNLSQKRLALVIGNSNYSTAPLRNPVNDALAMALVLENVGFEVMSYTNLGQKEMKQAIKQFGKKIAKAQGGIGLFYYAGHGMQVKGINYLIPTDANISKEQDIEYESVRLGRVMGEMEYAGTRMNIIILDACRDNPFSQLRTFFGQMTTTRGLARIETAPYGTFIAFATAPGSVAADGFGFNGLYTQELVKAIRIPNLKIEEVFKRVRTQVRLKSASRQIPWENSSIEGDFYFIRN
jgi:hypothetical protein